MMRVHLGMDPSRDGRHTLGVSPLSVGARHDLGLQSYESTALQALDP
jgi:hypothetical protein